MVVPILSKTHAKPTSGAKCFSWRSNWLFTGLPREFQATGVRRRGRFPVQNSGCQKLFWTRVMSDACRRSSPPRQRSTHVLPNIA